MSHREQALCPKRTNAKILRGGWGDPDTKRPFLKKILQVSGSAGASTLIIEFVVTIGSHCLAVGSRYISGDHGRPLISGGHQRPLN